MIALKNSIILFALVTLVGGVEWHGRASSYPIVVREESNYHQSFEQRIRAGASLWMRELYLQLAYEISPSLIISDSEHPINPLSTLPHSSYRVYDIKKRVYPNRADDIEKALITHNLDILSLRLRAGGNTVVLGRQTLGWGSARAVNPTDVITPLHFGEIYREERVGVDAIAVRRAMGVTGEMEFGFVAGRDLKAGENALFFRGRFIFIPGDLSLTAIRFKKHHLVGVDYEGSLRDAGVQLEIAYTVANRDEFNKTDDYLRLSSGVDRQMSENIYLFGEYHFNGAGKNRGEKPGNVAAYRDATIYLPGRHYLTKGTAINHSPLWKTDIATMTELSRGYLQGTLRTSLSLPRNESISVESGSTIHISGPQRGETVWWCGVNYFW